MSDDFQVREPRVLAPQERKARDALRRIDADAAIREHEETRKAFFENRERLKALRLERERQQPEPCPGPETEEHGQKVGNSRKKVERRLGR